jgi:predicted nucleic acid-binding protein
MSAEVLIDTNVLVYAFDADEPEKQRRAQELLDGLVADGSACVSSQVLGEFYVTVTRRFPGSMEPATAARHTERFAEVLEVHGSGLQVVLEALRGVIRYRLSYYDAQIWAVARLNHVPVVLSEDFSAETEIEGVRFVNPFAPSSA